jgi:flagella basal body P-ring formation protein FlgA
MQKPNKVQLISSTLTLCFLAGTIFAMAESSRKGKALLSDEAGQSGTNNQPIVKVVLSTRDIAVGEIIQFDNLKLVAVPADKVPEGALTAPDIAVGQASRYGIVSGGIVRQQDLREINEPVR